MPYKTKLEVIVTSEKPLVQAAKVEKAEAWVDSALTIGFNILGTFGKYNVTDVEVNAEVSEKA